MAARKTTAKKAAPKRSSKRAEANPEIRSVRIFFKEKALGRFLFALLVVLVLTAINMIVSGDRLETFCLMLGLELIAAIFGGWVIYLVNRRKRETEEQL